MATRTTGSRSSASQRLFGGVAVVDITPPKGYRMSGYFSERLNTGVHDPLHAKALYLRQGTQEMVIELCNDAPGYLPTRKAFVEGSYETVNSRIAPGGGEALVEAAVELLDALQCGF